MMSKLKIFDNLLFLIISSVIFITVGDFFQDYKKLIFLKLIVIFLISFKINFFKETKLEIKKNKIICLILALFVISLTISFVISPSKINQFLFEWLRIRYLDTITDIFLFIFLFLYFKNRDISYHNLIKSIILPGLAFSIFAIYTFISNQGLSDSSEEILFFDGRRMIGMLVTFLVTFYLGCLHSTFTEKKIQNIIYLTIFMTLAILLMGRGTIISILVTYFVLCILLFINKKKFKNEFLIFIFSILISILLAQVIFNTISSSSNNFALRNSPFLYTLDRFNLWKYGYVMFLENPYFGKGPGGFAITAYNDFYINKSYGDFTTNISFRHTHPHNFIIQFIVEWGIVGTVLIFVLLIIMSIRSIKYFFKFKNYNLLIPGLSIIGLTSHGLVDGALYHATFTFYYVLFLSILCSEISKTTTSQK